MPIVVDQSNADGLRKIVVSLNAQGTLNFPSLTSDDAINQIIQAEEDILIQRNAFIEQFETGFIQKTLRVYATGLESHYSNHYILDDFYRIEDIVSQDIKSKVIRSLGLKTTNLSKIIAGGYFKTDRIENILGLGVTGVNVDYDIDFNVGFLIRYV